MLGQEQKAQAVQAPALQTYGGQQGRAYRVGVGQSQAEPGTRGGEAGYGMRGLSYGRQRLRYGYGAQSNAPAGGGYGRPAQAATPMFRKQVVSEQAQAAPGPAAAATEPPLAKAGGGAPRGSRSSIAATRAIAPGPRAGYFSCDSGRTSTETVIA